MNKTELIDALAAKTALNKTQAAAAVNAIFGEDGIIIGSVSKGEEVGLHGFGTFKATERAARAGVNPATGAKIQIAAKKAIKFKPGKSFTASVA